MLSLLNEFTSPITSMRVILPSGEKKTDNADWKSGDSKAWLGRKKYPLGSPFMYVSAISRKNAVTSFI
ncbi:Uncharacterised protein [Mycobacteroides abscessus subsp. bolletii]|nr:Uncharacterised protein [Mycobacteroides abscessus subsp. bolletii]SKH97178.1 Uncharacterised protein [Mycobacteroides abscessus subsp. bolletii]SKK42452.1 Uncharacterised protein [Mycobacteroides abscessus subsp. bolletii]